MVITEDGTVGISTAAPSAKLDVYGSGSNAIIRARRQDSNGGYPLFEGYSEINGANTFTVSNNGQGYLKDSLLIGNTSATFNSPAPSINIEKTDNGTGPLLFMYNGASGQAASTCEIRVGQNFREANKIIFGRENSSNWQASAAATASNMSFHTNSAGTIAERMRITSTGAVVIRHGGATDSDGWGALEVRANKGVRNVVLASNSPDASDNRAYLAWKLHPSADDERAKACIMVQGDGGGYGQPEFMSFCMDTAADNGSADQNTDDERMRIHKDGFMGPIPRKGTWQGTYVYKQQNQGANYEHKIRGPMSGYLETEMDTNFVAYIKVQCVGTGTNNAYCYYRLSQDGENLGATLTHIHGNSGSNSNMPWMVLDGQHACWKTAHSVSYNFIIRVEVTGGDDGVTYTSSGSYAAN